MPVGTSSARLTPDTGPSFAAAQVPVDVTGVPAMYVFVDIGIDVAHLVDSVRLNFDSGAHLALAGTIQFAGSIQARLGVYG